VAVREQARFRAYESFQAAFDDFVAFLQGSPRYQQALSVAADSEAFTRELAQAGYATDPNYSSKIMGIVNSKEFNETLSAVKL
jgi:flagellar protein FlgJ